MQYKIEAKVLKNGFKSNKKKGINWAKDQLITQQIEGNNKENNTHKDVQIIFYL